MTVAARRFRHHLARIRENRAIVFLAMLSVAFLTLSLAARSPELLHLDRAVTQALQRGRTAWLDQAAVGCTFLGNGATLVGAGLIAAFLLLASGRPWAALLCAATLLGLPLNMWIKELVGRVRPDETLVSVVLPAVGLSFPSGHAMVSVLFYGYLALMAWIHIRHARWRRTWTFGFALIALCVSLSRVYLGVHWLSDVVGGWTAGLLLLLLLAEIYKVAAPRELAPAETQPD
jgi:undecaprenyl-diphosphatase